MKQEETKKQFNQKELTAKIKDLKEEGYNLIAQIERNQMTNNHLRECLNKINVEINEIETQLKSS